MRSQHFPRGMKIPTCSALYRKIFARTGSGKQSSRWPPAGSIGDTVPAQWHRDTSLPSRQQSTNSTHNFTFKCFNQEECAAEPETWHGTVCIFTFKKYLKNKQMPWYDKAPSARKQRRSSRVLFGSSEHHRCQHTDPRAKGIFETLLPEPSVQVFCAPECSGCHSAPSQVSSNFESLITFIQAVRFKG